MKMKHFAAFALAAVMALGCCACGQAPSSDAAGQGESTAASAAVPADQLKTLGDAFAIESEYTMASYNEQGYVYVFDNGGVPMRVVADMTKDAYAEIDKVDYSESDVDEKIRAIVSPLPIKTVEDLSTGIPAQEELDKLIGKTGQDLLDEGYVTTGDWMFSDDGTEFSMAKGLYQYMVKFNEILNKDGTPEIDNPDDAIKDLTVKSVTYERISDSATDL